ncbi:MAG: hypothetical protein CSA24_01915 [Deltaproteobacteria bacterium]|nr:MAG: hypothetical protein CSA24_01915 [Deltaproteobacteria bacterium]
MNNLSPNFSIPARLVVATTLAALGATPALAQNATKPGVMSLTTTDEKADLDGDKKWSASVSIETSIGIGTFLSEPHRQSAVSTTFVPSFGYDLGHAMSLSAGLSVTWYQLLGFGTPLSEHDVLMSDVSVGFNHGSIWKHEGSGFNLSGSLSFFLPTSLASQFQNRLFTLKPSLRASIPVGPVTFGYTLGFGKFFNLTATPTVDCEDFDNPDECIAGRRDNPDFGFESVRRGAEVYLPGMGTSSFYVQNAFSARWGIVEGLSLNLGISIFNNFGVRSQPEDGFTNAHAQAGRAQVDRLVSSLSLSYQLLKELSVATSLVTATARPFGADGNDFVIFDFSRAASNITSWNISVTGSL